MASKQYIPYDRFYKLKDGVRVLPDFWFHALAIHKKERIPYSTFYNGQK